MRPLEIYHLMKRAFSKVKNAIPIRFRRIAARFFNEFCIYNTLHGVRYFTVPVRHWSERLWWILSIGLVLWLSTLMIHSYWLEWQENPSTLVTTNEMNAISKVPFPTVIICPTTKIMREKFDLSSNFDSNNNQLLPNVSHSEKMRLSNLALICPSLVEVAPYKGDFASEDIFKVIQDVAATVEEITLSCSWKGTTINCSRYLEPVMTHDGVCFTFNGLNSRDIYTDVMAPEAMISKSNPNVSHWSLENGYERGFGKGEYPVRVTDSDRTTTLELNLVIDKRNDHRLCEMAFEEFTVYLMSPYETNTIMREPIGATLSQDTHIHVAPKLITTSNGLRKYSPIQRQCFFQNERRLRFFKTYSHKNCFLEYWTNFTKRFCGCVDFSMPRDTATKICGIKKMNCFLEAATIIKSSTDVKSYCLPACETTDYRWNLDQYQPNMINDKSLSGSQRQATFRISLRNDHVKTMQRVETVTIIDFLVVGGGVLGLFMGFSVLSIVDLIYHPFVRLYWTIQRMKEEDDEKERNRANQRKKSENDKKRRVYSSKRKSRLRSYLLEYCDNSSIHGLRYFSNPDFHWRDRCYWAICCVASLALCAWMICNVWIQWLASPVVIRSSKEAVSYFDIPLPTIVICPEVKTLKRKLDLTSTLNKLSNLSDIENQRLNALANVCPLLPNSVAFEDKFADESIYDTIQDIAPQFRDTLVACRWNMKRGFLPCSTRITSILTDEGLCFAFNALNSHEMYTNEMALGMKMVTGNRNISHWTLEDGYDSGFHTDEYPTRMTVHSGVTHFLMILSIDKQNFEHRCNQFDKAFKLILTPPGEVLKMTRNNFRLHLKSANTVHFDLKMLRTSDGLRSYTPDQRRCFFQSENRLRFFRMYTQANCEEECLANFTSLECGCVHFSMPRDNKTKVCGGASVACVKAAKRKFRMDKRGTAFHSDCHCLPACVSFEYTANIKRRAHEFSRNKRKGISVVTVGIKSVKVDERVERFTVIDFLAYCGGLLGMYMGISVLSIVEIVYFATLRLFLAILQWKSENAVMPLIPWH